MSGASADRELYQHDDALVVAILTDDARGLAAIAAARRASGRPFDLERACKTPLMMGFYMTPLQLAASEGKARAARELLRLGAAVDGRARKDPLDKDEYPFFISTFSSTSYYFDSARTPLMLTMYRKIGMGPPANRTQDARDHVAKEVIARMLLAEGASHLASDSINMRAIHYAVKVGRAGQGRYGASFGWALQETERVRCRAGSEASPDPGAVEDRGL